MKSKKLQIFVSSTYSDLKKERQAAVEAILSSGHIPAGMELFAAGDESQMTVIKRWIDESDIYLLILGGRYGSVEPKSGKSYIQLEYEYSVEKKKPLFAVVISEDAFDKKVKKEGRKVIEEKNQKLLDEFRAMVKSNMVRFWEDLKDIKLGIYETLSEYEDRKELIGWVRSDNSLDAGKIAEELARMAKENAELRDIVSQLDLDKNILYAGLTFKQLSDLLRLEVFDWNNSQANLIEFIMIYGDSLIRGVNGLEGIPFGNLMHSLKKYKLVKSSENEFGADLYQFTDDGHNFYLKALYYFKKPIIK